MGSVPSKLTAFQHEVLDAFFERERGFFLTGGAALAGFHLGHRTTEDLDLFTLQRPAFERGLAVLADVAAAVGAVLEVKKDKLGSKRGALRRREDEVVVDLVHDMSKQLHAEKLERARVTIDPADEILANKLVAARSVLAEHRRPVIGQPEDRDLVDIMMLERLGYPVEAALPATLAKNGACTPATLARLLSEVMVPDGVELPAAVAPAELRAYLADLSRRLLV
jgi:Nucleotidyl transferase AbiEii toxin, Type IV TA system